MNHYDEKPHVSGATDSKNSLPIPILQEVDRELRACDL